MVVVDLGAAPGSWSQIAVKRVGAHGQVIALDLLPVEPMDGLTVIEGDFLEAEVLEQLETRLAGARVDLVLSDMAPNMSGIELVDQARVMYLAELALDFCISNLKSGGSFVVKVFQGQGFMEYRKAMQQQFRTLQVRKPKASRDRSAEVYL